MKILIAGDMVIKQDYDAIRKIDQNIVKLFKTSDFNIVNLEAPVTKSDNKILKTGPHLKSYKKSTLEVLQHLNINITTLANNHIKDYDEQGVFDTISFCKENNIIPIGAGKDIEEASKTLTLDTDAGRIAIINIAENEWASADIDSAGANGMNLIKDTRAIQQAKKEHDYVFVIIHGGHEYYHLPSPRMQEQYRFYIDQGADLVVGHHPHATSGYEIYNNSPIYYSLGNFLFTKDSVYDSWYEGLILEIDIHEGKLNHLVHPIKQAKNKFNLELSENKEKINTLDQIKEINNIISNKNLLNEAWSDLVDSRYNSYLNYWSPTNFIKSKLFNGVKNRLKVNFSNKKSLTLYSNLIRCESHLDLSKAVIKKRIEKNENSNSP